MAALDESNVVPLSSATPPSPTDGVRETPNRQRARKEKEQQPIDWGRFSELCENFALIYSTDTAFDCRSRLVIKVNALRLAFGHDYIKMWLASDRRRMIMPDQLVFDPTGKCEPPCINLFDGFALKPKTGNCDALLELLRHLCSWSADTPEGRQKAESWVMKWLAMPLQRPGTKMRTALVFHGPQGAGKNLFFETLASIYGRYAAVIGQDQLEDKFNDWASQKMFLIGDEVVARQELYHHRNRLKAFITGETIQINAKMLPLRAERNHVNVVFLSNEQQPLALEDGDRRYFVVNTPARQPGDLYERVGRCVKNGGTEAFYAYLLSVDLTGFSEFEHPPMTIAKRDLIELGLKPAERFAREWLGGDLPLPLQVCSAGQLYRVFRRWCVVTGERFPPAQEIFTKTVRSTVSILTERARQLPHCANVGDLLGYKVIKLDDPVNGKRSERMWIPDGCGAPDGTTEGRWAADSVASFENALSRFMEETGATSA